MSFSEQRFGKWMKQRSDAILKVTDEGKPHPFINPDTFVEPTKLLPFGTFRVSDIVSDESIVNAFVVDLAAKNAANQK